MLSALILVALQFAAAFLGAPVVMRMLPVSGDLKIFVQAAVYAVIVWIVGLVGSFALKDVNLPSTRTLTMALIGAMIGAAMTLIPQVMALIPLKVQPVYLPLVGAIGGYFLRR